MVPSPRPSFLTAAALVFVCGACQGPDFPSPEELFVGLEYADPSLHPNGPGVVVAETGPARFARPLFEAFGVQATLGLTRSFQERLLTPGAGGFDECLDGFAASLAAAGFGKLPGLGLRDGGPSPGSHAGRTLVATIEGSARSHEAVALVTYLQGSGAWDNAGGAAGQVGLALALAELLREGEIQVPARTLVFLWGVERSAGRAWLAEGAHYVFAAVHTVMDSAAPSGTLSLMERHPDPGAIHDLSPEEQAERGAPALQHKRLRPNGLAVIARCALADVSRLAGGWQTSEIPFESEGGHERFIDVGVPTVLFRHAAPKDRESADGEHLRRAAVAAGATALALADPGPADLERYLLTNREELTLRVGVAEEAGEGALAERWRSWCTGVRHWFRTLCLGQAE
ncbi:MAG: hypothetical protein VYE81_08980 [Planctomycetota bacterium]|nr:hypothetical protein [Planctomycetota bacterium]